MTAPAATATRESRAPGGEITSTRRRPSSPIAAYTIRCPTSSSSCATASATPAWEAGTARCPTATCGASRPSCTISRPCRPRWTRSGRRRRPARKSGAGVGHFLDLVLALHETSRKAARADVAKPHVRGERTKERDSRPEQDGNPGHNDFLDHARPQESLDGLAAVDVGMPKALLLQSDKNLGRRSGRHFHGFR